MPVTVTMPQLGESVTEGTITRWLKAVGDTVAADEPLLEVSTDKVDTEIPAPASGVLLSIDAAEDDTVEVGGVLAVIGEPDDAAAAPSSEPSQPAEPATPEPVAADTPAESATPEPAPAETAPSEPATPEPATPEPVSGGSEVSVVLPALGESVSEGVITRWLKSVGDAVEADEPLVEISTDKVDTEIPAPVSGTLAAIAADTDATVEVGAEIARISTGASAPAPAAPAPAAPAPEASAPEAGAPDADSSDSNAGAYVTPLVRRLAAQHDIDLSTVTGSGVGGRIRKADVLAAVEARGGTTAPPAQPSLQQPAAPAAAPAPVASSAPTAAPTAPSAPPTTAEPSALRGRTENLSRLRRVIAERMVESLQTSAQLTTVVEVDVTRIAALRGRIKADFESREGVKLSFLPFFSKAAVEALKVYPQINSSIDMGAGTITYHESENLGIAVDTDRGLLVPVIRDAGDLNIAGIARRIADLAER
ncbi:MAG: 2-oxoglutarate dehydrogenase, E2 component, dihydrolipoamide succinyltransferase, partial [Actinomycetota bacterium]